MYYEYNDRVKIPYRPVKEKKGEIEYILPGRFITQDIEVVKRCAAIIDKILVESKYL